MERLKPRTRLHNEVMFGGNAIKALVNNNDSVSSFYCIAEETVPQKFLATEDFYGYKTVFTTLLTFKVSVKVKHHKNT